MKLKLVTVFFILISSFALAQNTDQAIRKSLVYFVNTIKYKKIDQTVATIYPKFFTVMSKEQMTQTLNMTYNNPFVKIDIQDMKFLSVGKPEVVDGENFSITTYALKMKADVSSVNEEMKKMISEILAKKYGKNNLKYLAKENAYLVNATMKVVAVSKDSKSWKVVFADSEYKKQLTTVLPKKILDQL